MDVKWFFWSGWFTLLSIAAEARNSIYMDWLISTGDNKPKNLVCFCSVYLQPQFVIFPGVRLAILSMEEVKGPYQET